jgi:arsenate reductase
MAEAILRSLGRGHFTAFSAGADAASAVDPHVLGILEQRHVSSDGLVPKHLRIFEGQSFDYVITLSDPAREQAPSFPGADVIHWSFADPEQSVDEQADGHPFEHLFAGLAQRIRLLMIIAERHERAHGPQATNVSDTCPGPHTP